MSWTHPVTFFVLDRSTRLMRLCGMEVLVDSLPCISRKMAAYVAAKNGIFGLTETAVLENGKNYI